MELTFGGSKWLPSAWESQVEGNRLGKGGCIFAEAQVSVQCSISCAVWPWQQPSGLFCQMDTQSQWEGDQGDDLVAMSATGQDSPFSHLVLRFNKSEVLPH